MSVFALTTYMLIWPVISSAILVLLVVSLLRDMRAARKSGKGMI